ncbi:MAG TPA: NrfD/PsrC family molybdoenzyme membrane anchor subunit, partial [Dehalococcoidia bacterium]|nr:NrfD/PsrC family molybdoenzyme membrane anchor subunit [Dehalococcoidia bacterium]
MEAAHLRKPNGMQPLLVTRPGYWLVILGLLSLVVWGLWAVADQWINGLGVTGMNNRAYWGLEIVNFVFFIGLSAGGIIIAALVHAGGMEKFKPVARIAELLAISCLMLALLFILISIGRPDRLFNLFIYGRITSSPLAWDVAIIFAYLALALALGYFGTRADLVRCMQALPGRRSLYKLLALGYTDLSPKALARDRRVLVVLSWIAIPGAIALHSLTAWILGLVKARPFWHTALIAPLFVTSAMVSGLALLIVTVVLARRFFKLDIKDEVIAGMGRLLFFAVPVLGYLLAAELLTVAYPNEPGRLSVYEDMIWGQYASLFWFDLIAGLLLPL